MSKAMKTMQEMAYGKTLVNDNILDETHNEATRRIGGLPGIGECYAKKATNLAMGEQYLVFYDKYGHIAGRLTVRNGVVVKASAERDDVRAILEAYVGHGVTTGHSCRNDVLAGGRRCSDAWAEA